MPAEFDISLVVGGDAGQGVESSGSCLSLALARAGLHVFSMTDYRSRIRGGHNFYQIRTATHPLLCHSDPVHLVVALSAETTDLHLPHLAPGGAVVYDASLDAAPTIPNGYPIPLSAIAAQHGSRVLLNTAALAAAIALIGLPLAFLTGVLRQRYQAKGADVVNANLAAATDAYNFVTERWAGSFPYRVQLPARPPIRMLLNGNEALALGAAAGGCRFMSAYPMTPATTIFEWLTKHAGQIGMVTVQAEDEIAAVLMAAGATFCGARAMTATSGGGYNLMTETLGMAAMAEIPLVIVDVQRGGPSTGLPTRTEQADLLHVLHPSHGDFPHIVLAPASVAECFTAGWRAFNLAEKYQCPVTILSDSYLASSLQTVAWDDLNLNDVEWQRGCLWQPGSPGGLRRFADTETGISPRCFPGQEGGVHVAVSEEHTEHGHITEDTHHRRLMMEKRMRKLQLAAGDMTPPTWDGPAEADLTLVAWGGPAGAAVAAARELTARGLATNSLVFHDLWPFPPAARQALQAAKRPITVEQNYSGQLAQYIRQHTGIAVERTVRKYDGRPLTPGQIVAEITQLYASVPV